MKQQNHKYKRHEKKTSIKRLVVTLVVCGVTAAAISMGPNAFGSGPGGGGGGGGGGGSGGLSTVVNVLRGPWESLVGNNVFTVTFNNNGTFTSTLQTPAGAITTDAGTWVLTATSPPEPFGNPQGHLVLVDSQGTVLLSGDVLLINQDQLVMLSAIGSVTGVPQIGELIFTKLTI